MQVQRLISLVGESVLYGSLTTDLVAGSPVQWRTEYVITGADLPQVRSAPLLSFTFRFRFRFLCAALHLL